MNRFFNVLAILFLSAGLSFGQTMEKDTIIITCFNGDSIAMAGLDTTKFYKDNISPPVYDISISNELSCEQANSTLNISLFSNFNQFKIEVINPLQDTIIVDDLSLEVSQAGIYTVLVRDLINGCVGVKNIEVLNNCYSDQAEYTPLVVENATWVMVSNTDVYAEITNYFAYKIEGDSLVNETSYKKVYRYELVPLDFNNNKYSIQERRFSTLIREDISERKIYSYPSRDEFREILLEEYVLYDFSKQLNDTITYFDGGR